MEGPLLHKKGCKRVLTQPKVAGILPAYEDDSRLDYFIKFRFDSPNPNTVYDYEEAAFHYYRHISCLHVPFTVLMTGREFIII